MSNPGSLFLTGHTVWLTSQVWLRQNHISAQQCSQGHTVTSCRGRWAVLSWAKGVEMGISKCLYVKHFSLLVTHISVNVAGMWMRKPLSVLISFCLLCFLSWCFKVKLMKGHQSKESTLCSRGALALAPKTTTKYRSNGSENGSFFSPKK